MSAKKAPAQPNLFAPTIWLCTLVIVLLTGIYLIFYEQPRFEVRTLAIVTAIALPTVLFFLVADIDWRKILGESPDPIIILLSGLAGLTIWPIAWWLMSVLDTKILFEAFGAYDVPFIYLPNNYSQHWAAHILGETLLVPLALTPLLWGLLRHDLAKQHPTTATLILASLFGAVATAIYGQGIVGFFGYGLCGLVAGFASLKAQSAWAGLAAHFAFMFANVNFLDNLLKQMAHRLENGGAESEPYFGEKWLALVMVCSLVTITLLQLLRFRSEPYQEASPPRRPVHLWFATAIIIIAFCVVLINELSRRMTL